MLLASEFSLTYSQIWFICFFPMEIISIRDRHFSENLPALVIEVVRQLLFQTEPMQEYTREYNALGRDGKAGPTGYFPQLGSL